MAAGADTDWVLITYNLDRFITTWTTEDEPANAAMVLPDGHGEYLPASGTVHGC